VTSNILTLVTSHSNILFRL